jgi:hypothetical protein
MKLLPPHHLPSAIKPLFIEQPEHCQIISRQAVGNASGRLRTIFPRAPACAK